MEDTHDLVDKRSIGGHKVGRTMANQQYDGASPSLPVDVVAEILAYLPAKSVGRLLCLSRSWHATLSSAPFFKLHLMRANKKPKVFFCPTDEPPFSSESDDDDYQFYAWQPGCAAVRKLLHNEFWCPALLTRPLHGFVLVRCALKGYYLFNPSTSEAQPLPDSRAPLKTAIRGFQLPIYSDVVYGFGYCSVSHKYKVGRIFSKEMDGAAPSCEVLVFKGDPLAYWRPAASQPPMCVVEEKNPAVFLHGRLHFLCRDDGGILTFNVGDETFGWLPQPPCPPGKAPLRTTELDGCLCVLHGHGDGPCNVWLLRDYAARRWEKVCCIDPAAWPELERTLLQSHWLSPLGICDGDNGSQRKIMVGTSTCMVFTVGIDGGGVPEILLNPDEEDIAGEFDDSYDFPAIGLFEESLVTFGKTTEDMVFSSPVTTAWSDVLKWLPARSVLQLSLVCREWRAMATTDCFIRSHAAVHATNSPRVMFLSDYLGGSFTSMCYDEDNNAIDVWMMKDDDGAWCVECRIELDKFSPEYSSEGTTLLCTNPTDGRILLNTGRSLGYYDPKTAALQTIYTISEQEGDFGFPVIVQDSLVRPFMKQTY
ncbi:hypothetical protein ACQ4PT_049829 [Festuca glaucescens]